MSGQAAAAPRRPGTNPLEILRHPGSFVACVLKGFRANQGLLLAGAVAYYTLLSMIPLLILMLIALSNFIDEARLFATLSEYLQFVVPGQADALVNELRHFLRNRSEVGGVLLVTMILFSALAFTVLENAMSVIFIHRVAVRRRRFIVSALLPYLFILFLAIGMVVVTVVAGKLSVLATRDITVFGVPHSLEDLSGYLLYLLGVVGEILMLTAIYLVMPVGRLSFRHAFIGGISAGLLWEITRHILVCIRDDIPGAPVVRIVGDSDHGDAERRDCRDRAAAGCAGDRRIRADRTRADGYAAEADGP
jgi:YihY family inner membrane protein